MIKLKTLIAEAKLNMSIPSDIKKIYSIFRKNGHQLYVVGGAVRDAILGSSPKDFDLATGAKPEEVIAMIKKDGTFKVGDEVRIIEGAFASVTGKVEAVLAFSTVFSSKNRARKTMYTLI